MNSNESIDSDRMNMSSPQNEGNKPKREEIRPKVIALFEQDNTLKDVLTPIKSDSDLNAQFSQYCFQELNKIANIGISDNNKAILKKLYSIAGQTYPNQIVSNQSKANNMISIPADRKFALNLFDKGRELGEIDVIIYRIQLSESVQNAVINNENILEFIEAIFTESRIIPWLIRASFKPLFFEYFVEYDYDEQKNMSTQEKYLKFAELRFLLIRRFPQYKSYIYLGNYGYFLIYLCLISKIEEILSPYNLSWHEITIYIEKI